MCNLGEGIAERAAERAAKEATERAVLNMHKDGFTASKIAELLERDIADVEAIIEKANI